MSETFKETVQRLAHRTATKYTHVARNGAPEYSFTEAQLGVFADFLRDELAKGQETVECNECHGTGKRAEGATCWGCDGTGRSSPFVTAPAGVPDGWRDLLSEIVSEADEFEQRTGGKVAGSWLVRAKAMLSAAPADAVAKDAERYQWLKENCALGIKQNGIGWSLNTRQCVAPDCMKELDASIDAARKEQK